MWNESRVLSWPLMFRRQYAQPLDIDSVFETLAEMETYLTNALRHVGQIATCQETEGIIYIMNNNRDAWVTVDAGSGSLVFTTITELNTHLTNDDRIAGGIATCLETEGVLYIMNNLRTMWISIDFNSKLNSIEFYSHTGDTSIHYTKDTINITDINSAHTHSTNEIDGFSLVFTHTGDTSIHYTKDTINITDINSAHTHGISEVNELQTALNSKTNLTSFNSHAGDTTIHFTKTSINISDINSAHTHSIADVSNLQNNLNLKTNLSDFNSHSGDTSIHYIKSDINISEINSAHTHSISEVSNLQNDLDLKTNLSEFNSHTGQTNPHLTEFSDLINTGHTTHIISDVINLEYSLNSKLNLTGGTLTGDLTGTTIAATTLSATTFIGVDTTEVKNLSNLSGVTVTDVFNNATVSTDGIILYPTDMIAGVREEIISGTTVQVNKFWSGELFTKPKQFVVFDKDSPLATDDYNIFIPDTNITITKVYYKTKATTVNFNINHSSNVDIWSSDKQSTTAVQFSDVINNPNCLAGLPVKYQASAIGASPANIHVTIYYTEG